ncbi:MAG: hypothetical protein MI674_00600 [Cytophagales bacterium]|nr:hypothetical protein [Cytophagales bacterium]
MLLPLPLPLGIPLACAHNLLHFAALQDKLAKSTSGTYVEDSTIVVWVQSAHVYDLTLIDLPGVFFGEGKDAGEERNEQLVVNWVLREMHVQRSVVLHVVPLSQVCGGALGMVGSGWQAS